MLIVNILILALLTMLPFVELRLSIPVGILEGSFVIFGQTISGMGLHPLLVFFVAIFFNFLTGILVFYLLGKLDKYIHASFAKSWYANLLDKARRRLGPKVDKYGVLGLAIFIGLPFPGSGVYMGSLGAHVLGFDKEQFKKGCLYGVAIAGIIVTTLVVGIEWLVFLF